jgi:hypothetical protein
MVGLFMFGLNNSTQENQNEKIEKLEKRFNHLETLYSQFLEEYGMTVEQLADFCANPNHFEVEAWKKMEEARHQLESKLQMDLKQIKNPKKTSQKYREIDQARNWLFVR